MAQAKVKKGKKEAPKFDPEAINWTGYKRKQIDLHSSIGSLYIGGQHTLDKLLVLISENLCKSYESQVSLLTERCGELSDIRLSYSGGYAVVYAKALETEQAFKKRVIAEEHNKWLRKIDEENNKEENRKRDMILYEKIKKKYDL